MFRRVDGASAADDAAGAVVGAFAVADAAGPIAFRLEKTFFRRLASGTFADGNSRPLAFGAFSDGADAAERVNCDSKLVMPAATSVRLGMFWPDSADIGLIQPTRG